MLLICYTFVESEAIRQVPGEPHTLCEGIDVRGHLSKDHRDKDRHLTALGCVVSSTVIRGWDSLTLRSKCTATSEACESTWT